MKREEVRWNAKVGVESPARGKREGGGRNGVFDLGERKGRSSPHGGEI